MTIPEYDLDSRFDRPKAQSTPKQQALEMAHDLVRDADDRCRSTTEVELLLAQQLESLFADKRRLYILNRFYITASAPLGNVFSTSPMNPEIRIAIDNAIEKENNPNSTRKD